MYDFKDFQDKNDPKLLRELIKSGDYQHVICCDSVYDGGLKATSNGVLYFSCTGSSDKYLLQLIDAKRNVIHRRSGVIGIGYDIWKGENPFGKDTKVEMEGEGLVLDLGGTAHAELEGVRLGTWYFASQDQLKDYLILTDNQGVYTKLKKETDSFGSLDPKKLEFVRETARKLGGTVGLVKSKVLKVSDFLNQIPFEKKKKQNVLNVYKTIRSYSTAANQNGEEIIHSFPDSNNRPSLKTARVLLLITKDLDQEIFKYVKEGKVTLILLGYYPRIPSCKMSRPERVVPDIASLFRDAGLPMKSINTIMGVDGFPELERYSYNWDNCVFKLLCVLCALRKKSFLETARMLALQTKELDQEILKYIREGQVEYLCALMLLGYYTRIPSASVECFEGDESTKQQKLQLVEIFQRIGDKLQVYIRLLRAECKMSRPERVVPDIASLFRDAGLPVKSIDTIMDVDGFPELYLWEKEKSGTVGEENRSTIEAYRILLTNNGWDLIKRVKPALRSDDEVCVKRSLEIERDFHLSHCSIFSPRTLLTLLCTYRAENCACAFVQGQAGFFPDNLNGDPGCGLPPLHLAAQNLSSGVTEAFLMAGADPNLCCLNHDYGDDDGYGHDDIANLPLCLAVEALSRNPCVTDWSVDKSVVKLIDILCLEELKEPLDTIRILASRTQALKKLSLQYAQKGQVVQLTALLLVAWNKLVTPYVNKQQECRVEHCPIGQCIMNELQSLSSNQQMTTAQCTTDLVKLKSAWRIIKLLESKYHQIDNFHLNRPLKEVESHEVPCIVSMSTGIGGREDVKCDDIQCLMPRLNPKQKVWLGRALQNYSGPPAVSLFGSRKGFAATMLLSRSFHTPTKVEKPAFRQLLPTARTCAYLVSMAKRRLK